MYLGCPHFKGEAEQHKTMVLRRRYWLYYLLTFLSGARRQIFVVFAGFLMVEKFGFTVSEMTLLFLVNGVLSIYLAPRIGRLVVHWGERRTLTLEYVGLVIIFTAYAFAESAWFASDTLHSRSHIFRDGDRAEKLPEENCRSQRHGGYRRCIVFNQPHCRGDSAVCTGHDLDYVSPAMVFIIGAGFAFISLLLSQLIPGAPDARLGNVFYPKKSPENLPERRHSLYRNDWPEKPARIKALRQ